MPNRRWHEKYPKDVLKEREILKNEFSKTGGHIGFGTFQVFYYAITTWVYKCVQNNFSQSLISIDHLQVCCAFANPFTALEFKKSFGKFYIAAIWNFVFEAYLRNGWVKSDRLHIARLAVAWPI